MKRLAVKETFTTDIVERLQQSAVGKPARIPWPHRVLHDAADEIVRLRRALDGLLPFASFQLAEMKRELNPEPLETAIKQARAALGGDA